jgi:hypothetical protein
MTWQDMLKYIDLPFAKKKKKKGFKLVYKIS